LFRPRPTADGDRGQRVEEESQQGNAREMGGCEKGRNAQNQRSFAELTKKKL
jgi:hypothetical protein